MNIQQKRMKYRTEKTVRRNTTKEEDIKERKMEHLEIRTTYIRNRGEKEKWKYGRDKSSTEEML